MRYPNYDAGRFPPPDISLVDAYMTLIGRDERDNQAEIDKLPRGSTRRASFQIGRACLLGKRSPSESLKLVQCAHSDLNPKDPLAQYNRTHTYRTIARMIALKDDANSVSNLRRNLHRQAIETMAAAEKRQRDYAGVDAPEFTEQIRSLAGIHAENRITALLNRPLHPWSMAVAALEHHDRNASRPQGISIRALRARNFDIALIESFPKGIQIDPPGDQIRLHKLQIKRDCFGFCARNDHLTAYNRDEFETEVRPNYTSDITLLSGCCDTELEASGSLTRINTLLKKEFHDQASAEDTMALDGLTNRLLYTVRNSEALGRRGQFDTPVAFSA